MKNIFIILFLFVSSLVYSQQKDSEPKTITFSIGPEFRITPIWINALYSGGSERAHVFFSEDAHLSGSVITYSLFYSPKKNKVEFWYWAII